MKKAALLLVLLGAVSCRSTSTPPDLILAGGRVFTSDAAHPWAQAVAIAGDHILAVGSDAEVRPLASPATRTIELHGRVVIPGINDAHLHQPWSMNKPNLEIPDTATVDDVFARVVEATKRYAPGTLIAGTIPVTLIDESRLTRDSLDAIAPLHPVMLGTLSAHAVLHNTAALRMRNIAEDEGDVHGGWFGRSVGRLNGWVTEYALWAKDREIGAQISDSTWIASLRDFANSALRFGITSVQSMSSLPADRAARLAAATGVPLRWRFMQFEIGAVDTTPVTATKYILDGTPIERGAALTQPYSDRPGTSGTMDWSDDEIRNMVRVAAKSRKPLLLHVSGDRPFATIFSAMDATPADWPTLRVRIEHGDFIKAYVGDAKRLGVVVVQNPSHFMLGSLTTERIGVERQRNFQPLRSLIEQGIPVAIGSDGPLNPYLNIMFATIHADNPSEGITREQAVVAYTRGSAYAEFAEKTKGTIAPGMLADLAVLSQDIFSVPAPDLPKTEADVTIVGGRIVYER
jgi:predicted amidohydrolase YtcJ